MIRALVAVALLAGVAAADTKRVAVVVGNNAGVAQPPLSFAETDAGKIARVLVELGGVEAADLFLLQGKTVAAVRQTLALATARVAAFQRDPSNRVVVIFYFSGHSDGEALELGRERLPFGELRRWLSTTNAEVRLALVDSCKSGGLLRSKGGTRGPAFQIRLTDDLASTGEALLTSSAADELALESREIGGSFFTHHLVSGMRGAADASGDGVVTLTEAYRYAYTHTITTTGATIVGPQHPVYDYRLSGQGELILTELSKPSALLELPQGFERVLVTELVRDQVIAEMTSDAQPRIAVQPGRFAVRAWRGGRVYASRITVGARETRRIAWTELAETTSSSARAKGSLAPRARDFELAIAAGTQAGVADDLGPQASARLAMRTARPTGASLALTIATGTGPGFRETAAFAFGGYRIGTERGRARAWAGAELGAGIVQQSLDGGASSSTAAAAIALTAGASLRLSPSLALALEAQSPITVLRKDGETTTVALPGAWLGFVIDL